MISTSVTIRVRYAETDKMGVVYHGAYFPWFEEARIALLDQLGIAYSEIEKLGYYLPVRETGVKYLKPAHFDDRVTIIAHMEEKPTVKIRMNYQIKRGKELLCEAFTLHAFIDHSGSPVKPPAEFRQIIQGIFASDKNA